MSQPSRPATTDRKRLFANMASLFTLQGANYLLPLIIVPYLVRVLGPENFGRVAFAQAFIQYFVVMTDYGFNLSATRTVALVRDDPEKLSNLFSAVMIVKTALMALGFGIMLLIVLLVPSFAKNWSLYTLVYLIVLGNVLFPTWLFQGLERMRHITIFTILARMLSVIAIIALVHKQSDYLLAAALQASGMVIAGLLALVSLTRLAPLRLQWPGVVQLREVVVDSWHLFVYNSVTTIYANTNIFFLGILTNPVAVGYFSAADKIVQAVRGLVGPISQAVYPHITLLKSRSDGDALVFIRTLLRLQGAAMFALSLALFLFAVPIVGVLLGNQFQESVILVKWMAVLPFILGLSNVLGIQTMLIFGMKKNLSHIYLTTSIFSIFLLVLLIYWFGAQGAAISVVISEIVLLARMAMTLANNGLLKKIADL
ncbi:flippase [Acidithiobacillus sp. YTS05]|nr:flippase [Acidithiobacillus sp. YTS05]